MRTFIFVGSLSFAGLLLTPLARAKAILRCWPLADVSSFKHLPDDGPAERDFYIQGTLSISETHHTVELELQKITLLKDSDGVSGYANYVPKSFAPTPIKYFLRGDPLALGPKVASVATGDIFNLALQPAGCERGLIHQISDQTALLSMIQSESGYTMKISVNNDVYMLGDCNVL